MAKWINRTLFLGTRNGTNSHTVPFTAATAGNLLVAIAYGSATSTTPTGWTLPTNGSAINSGGLYVWYKTATSGESSFSTTHNGTNYAIAFMVYEFPAGSTFGTAAKALNVAQGVSSPTLTGQTGTSLFIGLAGTSASNTTGTFSTVWNLGVKDLDIYEDAIGASTGYAFSITYLEDSTATIFDPAATVSLSNGAPVGHEGIVFKLTVAAGGATTLDNVKSGTTTVATAYVGTTNVSKMYAGTVQVFP